VSRATPKDLGLALLVAFLVAQGPLTPAALAPSLVAGALAAGAFLYFRLSRVPARRRAARGLPEPPTEPVAKWEVPLAAWLCFGLLGVVSLPTWVWMRQTYPSRRPPPKAWVFVVGVKAFPHWRLC